VTIPEKILPLVKGVEAERLYHSIIIDAANRYQVDPAIVKAIIMAESSYNPKAVSKKGAKGLMQLMPKTAAELGIKDSFNPVYNINGGVKYYKKMLNQFNGDVKLALAAYNAGSRKVKKYQGIPPFKATHHYIKKVFKYYQYYKKQIDIKRV
jgi:soluble lytic murein transglycosylase-like protein